ncbi:hypothetical protein [Collimonas pratensis]|uniref:Phage protein n=1 Tax=Collimonas pratensis TaxID=279113 RepID=A0ABM5Z9J5_9BURK|nr:hypothetical protein [Collimonas pratensis]AMP15739.1 hypothetical protein CPter291_3504 [Collimonas pratensis]
MSELKTYVVETTNAFVTLAVLEQGKRRPYHAEYIGTPRFAEYSEIDDSKQVAEEFDGHLEDSHFEALLAACHREIAERAGEIINIEDTSSSNEN